MNELKFVYDAKANVTRVYLKKGREESYIGAVRGEVSDSKSLSTKVFIADNIIYEDNFVKIVADPTRSIVKK